MSLSFEKFRQTWRRHLSRSLGRKSLIPLEAKLWIASSSYHQAEFISVSFTPARCRRVYRWALYNIEALLVGNVSRFGRWLFPGPVQQSFESRKAPCWVMPLGFADAIASENA